MKLRKILAILLALIFVMAPLAGCGSGDSGAPAAGDPGNPGSPGSTGSPGGAGGVDTPSGSERSRVVNIGYGEKPRTLDPGNFRDQGSKTTIGMMYETLIYSPHDGSGYLPMLAHSWDIDPDGMYWIFYLRDDVYFHHGTKMTSVDVVASFQRQIDHRGELEWLPLYLPDLEYVEAIDEYTVKIGFSNPVPLAGNAFRIGYIFPADAFEEFGEDLWHLQRCYGTGPWQMVEWIDGQYSHFKKFDNYWNRANFDSYFDEVFIHHIQEPTSAVAAHLAGSLDAYTPAGGVDNDLLSMYLGREHLTQFVDVGTNANIYTFLQFGEGSIWHDERVRQAFSMSINRQSLIDNVLGRGELPRSFWHEGVIGFLDLGGYEYNPDRARQLLAESDYDGRDIIMLSTRNLSRAEDICLVLAGFANAVGFNMVVQVEDAAVFSVRRDEADYDLYIHQGVFPDGLPGRHYNRIMGNTDRQDYENEEMFHLIRTFNSEMDEGRRRVLSEEINRMITLNVAPQITFMHLVSVYAVDYGVAGIAFYADGELDFSRVTWDPSMVP